MLGRTPPYLLSHYHYGYICYWYGLKDGVDTHGGGGNSSVSGESCLTSSVRGFGSGSRGVRGGRAGTLNVESTSRHRRR